MNTPLYVAMPGPFYFNDIPLRLIFLPAADEGTSQLGMRDLGALTTTIVGKLSDIYPPFAIHRLSWTRDGSRLVCPTSHCRTELWEVNATVDHSPDVAVAGVGVHATSLWCAATSPDGRYLATGGGRKLCLYLTPAAGDFVPQPLWHGSHEQDPSAIAWSNNGLLLAVGDDSGAVTIYQAIEAAAHFRISPSSLRQSGSGQTPHVSTPISSQVPMNPHSQEIIGVGWVSGALLVSASLDGTIQSRNVSPEQESWKVKISCAEMHAYAQSADYVVVGADKLIRVLDVTNGKEVAVLSGHYGTVSAVSFSHDARFLASWSEDATIRIWRAHDWHSVATLRWQKPPHGRFSGFGFCPTQPTLAATGAGGTVRLWRLERDEFLQNDAQAAQNVNTRRKMTHDVFVCHASEDKGLLVDQLSRALRDKGLRVWYDDFELRLGDSLTESINRGLANSRFGIVVLSQNFFARRWPRRELHALLAIEKEGRKVVLPILHQLTVSELATHYPELADRKSASTEHGIDTLISEIMAVVGSEHDV